MMTVASRVKETLANLKGIEATLSHLALEAKEEKAKDEFHECCLMARRAIKELEQRIGEIEREEPQYIKDFRKKVE